MQNHHFHDTPVMAVYRQWQEAHTALQAATESEDEIRLTAEVADLTDRILDLPPFTPMDTLAKIAAQTLDGECGLDSCPRGSKVIAEAVGMVAALAALAHRSV